MLCTKTNQYTKLKTDFMTLILQFSGTIDTHTIIQTVLFTFSCACKYIHDYNTSMCVCIYLWDNDIYTIHIYEFGTYIYHPFYI